MANKEQIAIALYTINKEAKRLRDLKENFKKNIDKLNEYGMNSLTIDEKNYNDIYCIIQNHLKNKYNLRDNRSTERKKYDLEKLKFGFKITENDENQKFLDFVINYKYYNESYRSHSSDKNNEVYRGKISKEELLLYIGLFKNNFINHSEKYWHNDIKAEEYKYEYSYLSLKELKYNLFDVFPSLHPRDKRVEDSVFKIIKKLTLKEATEKISEMNDIYDDFDDMYSFIINELYNKINNLYELKEDTLNNLNLKPIEYHEFLNGNIHPYYKINNFGFHGNKISLWDTEDGKYIVQLDVDKISSENKLDKINQMSVCEAKDLLLKEFINK